MDLQLNGKTAMVTGASRGIGRAIAEALAREGCNLILVARSGDALEEVSTAIRTANPVSVAVVVADLSQLDVVEGLPERFPDVDILVNNAGAIPHGRLTDVSDAIWQEGWSLKVHGTVRLTRGIYRRMKRRGGGVVVNIIGYAGDRVNGNYIIGSSGNASLIGFTRALGAVSPEDGIRVVGINPGPVLTQRLQRRLEKAALEQTGNAADWPGLTKSYPFGRPAHPAEIADAVCFLASERAGYTTGTTLTIDGGLTYRPPPA